MRNLAKPDRPGGAITLARRLAHARRDFFDVHKRTADPFATEALCRIGEVYAAEARISGLGRGPAVRRPQGRSPLMAALRSWLMERLAEIWVTTGAAAAA